MENRKNLCAMIPESLHQQVREEQEKLALTLSQYVEQVLQEHFTRGGKAMSEKTRTLAFQVSEELFARIKAHLAKTGMSQKDFVIGLIEQALAADEAQTEDHVEEANEEQNEEPVEASLGEPLAASTEEPVGEQTDDTQPIC